MRIRRSVPAPCDRAAIQYTMPGGTIRRIERRLPCTCCRVKSARIEGTVKPDTTLSCMPTAEGRPCLPIGPWKLLVRKRACLMRPCRAMFGARRGGMMAVPGMVQSALAAVADVLVAPRRRRSHAGGRRENLPARDGQ